MNKPDKRCHDGKWLMFELIDTTLFDDFIKLLRPAVGRGAGI